MDELRPALLLVAALTSAVVGGVFYGFSTFVMRALARLPASQGAAAMQTINVTVFHPAFMGAFLGGTALTLGLGVDALWFHPSGWGAAVVGSALYVVGTFGITAAFNVPLNEALARAPAEDPSTAALWERYLRTWTAWNHVRSAAAIAAAAAFILALAAPGAR